LALDSVVVDVTGQVNNYAVAALRENSGGESFYRRRRELRAEPRRRGAELGYRARQSGRAELTGPADLLGSFYDFLDPMDFGETGFGPLNPLLGAGQSYDGLNIAFGTSALGQLMDVITFTWPGQQRQWLHRAE
jgi:hypothetical protein